MRPFSLRTRLTLSFAAILVTLLAALGVVYYRTLALQLDAEATTSLGEVTSAMHGYLRFDQDAPTLVYDRNDPDEAAFITQATRYYQIYDNVSGQLLVASPAMELLGLHYTPEEVRSLDARPHVQDLETDDGRIRLSTTVISPTPKASYLLQVGISLANQDAALRWFLWVFLLSIPAGLIIAVVAGRWMAARALTPLSRLASASRAIDVTDLARRLPVRGTGDELDNVAEAFNDTLSRLEDAVGEMKQFSAALAHELRTPLAVLRAEAEHALAEPRTPDQYQQGLADEIDELDRLTRLVNQVLTLARAEAGEIALAKDRVDLHALCVEVVDGLESVAQAKGVSLTCSAGDRADVFGDAGWLERLLLNLLDNAIKFTPAGGRVAVAATADARHVELRVEDSGIGIGGEALPHVFERFYQVDTARSREGGGAGLGLSLARWIADRHHATIEIASEPGKGTIAILRLPLAPTDVRSPD